MYLMVRQGNNGWELAPVDSRKLYTEQEVDEIGRKIWYILTARSGTTTHYCMRYHQFGKGDKDDRFYMEWTEDPEEAVLFTSAKQAWYMWFGFKRTTETSRKEHPDQAHDWHADWHPDVVMKLKED